MSLTRGIARPAGEFSVTGNLRGGMGAMLGLLTWLALLSPVASADTTATRHVILITLDGIRTQDMFGGMDPVIAADPEASGIYEEEVIFERYWRDTAGARRQALMPHWWSELVPQGMLLGNRNKGSAVTVQNDQWFSYPGYSEILTGKPQSEVQSNDLVRYPHATFMDYLVKALPAEKSAVAQIGSWDGFAMAASEKDGSFMMTGAYADIPAGLSTPRMDLYSDLRRNIQGLWEEGSTDAPSFRLGKEYLLKHKPRMLWIGLGQSDDWAHARRYDLLLDYLHLVDSWIADLWTTVQSTEGLRDQTTLIVTTDHGRGLTLEDWVEHGREIPGCADIWMFILGPDTPALGEVGPYPEVFQGSVASTSLQLMGLDWTEFDPDAAPPVPGSVRRAPVDQ
jgi:hypothetical protein